MKIQLPLSLALFMVFGLPSCSTQDIIFPDTDLTYQAIEYGQPQSQVVGFVNADGSENTLIDVGYRASQPLYSKELGGIIFHAGTNPVELSPDLTWGKIYFIGLNKTRKICNDLAGWFILPLPKTNLVVNSTFSNIQIIELNTCKVVKTLVKSSKLEIYSISVSEMGNKVIYDVRDSAPFFTGTIYSVDVATGETIEILKGGGNPSLSPDGKQIAYVGEGGIYIARIDEHNGQLVVRFSLTDYSYRPGLLPAPLWSPDGKLLIYHKCLNKQCWKLTDFSIFKLNVETGVEDKVIDNGLFPVWIR